MKNEKKKNYLHAHYPNTRLFFISVLIFHSRHHTQIRAPRLQKMNMVSSEKKKDVKKLMQFFEMPKEAKGFYEDVLRD